MRYQELDEDKFKGSAEDLKLWKIRSTLLRIKRPQRVLESGYQQQLKSARGQRLDPENPPDRPFDCADAECESCFPQYFPATVEVNDAEARHSVQNLVRDMFDDLDYLRVIVQNHGGMLISRWRNKSKVKRGELLKERTDLFPNKWAAIHLLDARNPQADPLVGKITSSLDDPASKLLVPFIWDALQKLVLEDMTTNRYRDTWLLPYLDRETLADDPQRFLRLLHYRTSHTPAEWAAFDNSQLVLSEHLGVLVPEYNKHCVVMQGPRFGELVPWNAEQAHRWEIIGFNKAQHLLTAQAAMARLLRKVVSGLLPNANLAGLCNGAQPNWESLAKQQSAQTDSMFSILGATYINQPYSSPPTCNPASILDMVITRHHTAQDDLWQLQTDPAYVRFRIQELSSAAYFEGMKGRNKWSWFVDEIMFNANRREIYWRQLLVECKRLLEAHMTLQQYPKSDTARQGYDSMLWIVQDCCIELLALQVSSLDYSLPFQRGFERNFELIISESGRQQPTVVSKDYFHQDPLFWSLSCIGHDSYRPFTLDPVVNFRVLDDCISSKKEAARLSQYLYDHISDMAVVDEIRSSIRCHGSRNCVPSIHATNLPLFRKDYFKKIKSCSVRKFAPTLAKHLEDLCTKHQWPGGIKGSKWLAQATASRETLARYWSDMRNNWREQLTQAGVSPSHIIEEMEVLSADQTEDFMAEIEAERRTVLASLSAPRPGSKLLLADYIEVDRSTKGENHPPSAPVEVKIKNKTRKLPDQGAERAFDFQRTGKAQMTPQHQVLCLKKESVDILRHMYSSAGQESNRKYAWQHFCSAMIDAGFSISQGSGSAVSFKRMDSEDGHMGKSIVIHRPHPDPYLDPVILRYIGKRMTRRFNWSRDSFVEREKNA